MRASVELCSWPITKPAVNSPISPCTLQSRGVVRVQAPTHRGSDPTSAGYSSYPAAVGHLYMEMAKNIARASTLDARPTDMRRSALRNRIGYCQDTHHVYVLLGSRANLTGTPERNFCLGGTVSTRTVILSLQRVRHARQNSK